MQRTLAFRTALARRVLVAAGVLGSVAVGCGDDSATGGSGAGGNNVGGENQGGNNVGGDSQGGAPQGGDNAGGDGHGGAPQGGAAQGGDGQGGAGGGTEEGVQRCFPPGIEGCLPISEAETSYPCTNDLELVEEWLSGPTEVGKECCYQVIVSAPGNPECGVIGRPLLVDDVPQRALVHSNTAGGKAWGVAGTAAPDVTGLSATARAELAKAWADDAAYEHASVASFSKFSLELMAFGAPAHLVAAAHEAALDEIRHASLGFALASAYAGQPLSPGKLEAAGTIACASDLESLVASAVREGCVGETLAALVAGAQSAVAADSAVRHALLTISEDETRHAELAWRTVVWAIEVGGEPIKAAARAAFESAIAAVEAASVTSERAHHAHGRLSGAEAQAERLRGLNEVVRPAMHALLG